MWVTFFISFCYERSACIRLSVKWKLRNDEIARLYGCTIIDISRSSSDYWRVEKVEFKRIRQWAWRYAAEATVN